MGDHHCLPNADDDCAVYEYAENVSSSSHLDVDEEKSTKSNLGISDDRKSPDDLDDFRSLSLFPTGDELAKDNVNFIRSNIIRGAYANVEHYLDVQFRLLREDFIGSLRAAIREYKESTVKNNRYDGIRLYGEVKFVGSHVTTSQRLGVMLEFDAQSCGTQLKYGSLLLFTQDDFQTYFCGTVLEYEEDEADDDAPCVKLVVDLPEYGANRKHIFGQHFLMAEAEAFFGAYHWVMRKLRALDQRNFPFADNIVKCSGSQFEQDYLAGVADFKINQPLWNLGRKERYFYEEEDSDWALSGTSELNESQRKAFRTALTSNFCLIQGPPGTGKTFLTLEIVRTMLKTLPQARRPILIVSYTNHALDQILEGVVEFTWEVVRLGGAPVSYIMDDYKLHKHPLRRDMRKACIPSALVDKIRAEGEEVKRLNRLLKAIKKPEGLLVHSILVTVMEDDHKHVLKDEQVLIKWLLPPVNALVEYDSNLDASMDQLTSEFSAMNIRSESEFFCVTRDDIDMYMRRCLEEIKSLEFYLQNISDCEERTQLTNRMHRITYKMQRRYLHQEILDQYLKSNLKDPEQCELILKSDLTSRYSLEGRLRLYWGWMEKIEIAVKEELISAEVSFRSSSALLDMYKLSVDASVLKQMEVIGMTTTCAARSHELLELVKPAIVIVEEAAEVLEAHVVGSLPSTCDKLILIGDHKQLRPRTMVPSLAAKYHFDVSLFERLINNGMHCPMLRTQYRMRPEISKLIVPSIYPTLENHESVENYEQVRGMDKNVFFLDHHHLEEEACEGSSKVNRFEVDYLLELCNYLINQGHAALEMTILSPYSAQVDLFEEKKQLRPGLEDVYCVTVDNFQGEENDIILLSLVRNNIDADIGFLNSDNRVCVALSRARKGLYMVGNMDKLCSHSRLWQMVKERLEEQEAIGRSMTLHCKKHDCRAEVCEATDFETFCKEGCLQPCGNIMKCGHVCYSICHGGNLHDLIQCPARCVRTCHRLHKCKRLCHDDLCPPCTIVEERLLPCGHRQWLPCYSDSAEACKHCPSNLPTARSSS